MVNSTDNTNNKSQEMEHLASQLSRQLNHSHSQVIQLTSENERLRAQLEALRGGGQQNDSGGASASAVNQQQTGQDLDEACDMTSAHEDCSPCPNQDRTLRPKQKRKYIPESESDDEDPIPIKSEGQKTKTANTNTGYVKKQGAEPSAELQRKRPFDTDRLSQSLEESTALRRKQGRTHQQKQKQNQNRQNANEHQLSWPLLHPRRTVRHQPSSPPPSRPSQNQIG